MLSLKVVNEKIQSLIDIRNDQDATKKQLVAARKKLQEYTVYRMYLESSPSESFLKKEAERIENRIELLKPSSVLWYAFSAKQKSEYKKQNGIDKLEKQLKSIKFILNK